MRDRNPFAVSVLICVLSCTAFPSACQGGCCDWLFRSRAQRAAAAQPPGISSAVGQANPNQVAATTAGYAPQASCGPGFCQQTVLRYMPQVAYRTAYQPVPVTTYKTSTSINPANGLPMTCTRPCTTYAYQAQRVPYTTYRPVYTTVPVVDPALAAAQSGAPAAQVAPSLAPAATSPYTPNYGAGYQPAAACSSCQTGASAPYAGSAASTLPGYTPGNGSLAPAPADIAPSLQNTLRPDSSAYAVAPNGSWGYGLANPAGATPWQPVMPPANTSSSYGYGAADGAPSSSTTPWQSAPGNNVSAPPNSFNDTAADRAPALPRTGAPEQRSLRPVPLPESIRRGYYSDTAEPESRPANPPASLFNTPNGGDRAPPSRGSGTRPELQAPDNQEAINQSYQRRWAPGPGYSSGAVKDLDRTPPSRAKPSFQEDKTAQRGSIAVASHSAHSTSHAPAEANRDLERGTGYAAIPIDWRARNEMQSDAGARTEPRARRRTSEWVPR